MEIKYFPAADRKTGQEPAIAGSCGYEIQARRQTGFTGLSSLSH
jgi:hypothetical protein